MSKLIIIDGNAILHRAYHALPPLTNTQGQLTNAVYGFISMLFKIRDDLKPTHLVICFDRPEPTFRKQMYVGYQAKRPKMDKELISQLELVKKAVEAMRIPIYELAGYEADDIIGSLAFQAKNIQQPTTNNQQKKIDEIIIVTGDRDILQLVDKKTKVYMPIQGLTLAKLYGEKEIVDKFGIKPSQVVDYKALVGDSSDNYPGVKGVGPKTASTLLGKYQTLEAIYKAIENKNLSAVSDKIIKALSEEVNEANMAKKLAKIERQAPVTFDVDEAKMQSFDNPQSRSFFAEMGFRSLEKRLTQKGVSKVPKVSKDEQLSLV